MIGLNEYLYALAGPKETDKIGETELNKTLLNSILNTRSRPRCPILSRSPVRTKNNSYFLRIKPHLNKELFEICVVYEKILPGLERRLITVR